MIEITDILDIENHISGLNAIIFDMDDTLYSEKEYIKSGYREISKLFSDSAYAERKLWTLFSEGKRAIDEFLKQENLYSQELKEACLREYRLQMPNIGLYDGVKELLEKLHSIYKLGLITDGRPEGQRAKIKALKLENYFDEIIVTDELGGPDFRKPNPKAFQIMKKKLGEEYSQMCYVGDNIQKDFIAPEILGMRSVWFRNPDGLYRKD